MAALKHTERSFENNKIWITAEGARHPDPKLLEINFKKKIFTKCSSDVENSIRNVFKDSRNSVT